MCFILSKGIVAVARRMSVIMFVMLTKNEPCWLGNRQLAEQKNMRPDNTANTLSNVTGRTMPMNTKLDGPDGPVIRSQIEKHLEYRAHAHTDARSAERASDEGSAL